MIIISESLKDFFVSNKKNIILNVIFIIVLIAVKLGILKLFSFGTLYKKIIVTVVGVVLLIFIYITKNKYCKKGRQSRLLLDILFVFDLTFVSSMIFEFFLYNEIIKDFLLSILVLFICFYLFISVLKNLILWSLFQLILVFVFLFLTGWISLIYWQGISLITVFINQFTSYEDVKYLYGRLKMNFNYSSINQNKTKEQLSIIKFHFNILILIFYIDLVFTDKFQIFESFFKLFGHEMPEFIAICFKGLDRFIIIVFISVFIYTKVNEKKLKLLKIMEKFIIRTN